MSLSRSPTTTTDAASVNSSPARSTPLSQRMLSLSSIARLRRGAASISSSRVQICASSRPRTASVSLSMATRGWMKNPAETPSPAAPSPRRLASRPAKLISVVSWATTIRRPARRRLRAPRQGCQHLLAGHRRGRQKTVDRQFAGTRRTELADHQRTGRGDPFDQLRADRRAPCVAEIAQCPSLFHHDNPPFPTGSQNRDSNRFASQMCEYGRQPPAGGAYLHRPAASNCVYSSIFGLLLGFRHDFGSYSS